MHDSLLRHLQTCARPPLFTWRTSQLSFACSNLPPAPSPSPAVHARLSSLHIQRFPPIPTSIRHMHPHSIPPRLPDHPSTTLTASGTQPTSRSVQQNVTSEFTSVHHQSRSPHVTTRGQPQARPNVDQHRIQNIVALHITTSFPSSTITPCSTPHRLTQRERALLDAAKRQALDPQVYSRSSVCFMRHAGISENACQWWCS